MRLPIGAPAVFGAALALVVLPCAGLACSRQDVQIRQGDIHIQDPDRIRIVGELFNDCADPVGARLQITFRDKAGKVVDVDEPWPASLRNIAPKDSYPFAISENLSRDSFETMSIRVIDIKRWPDD